MLRALAEGTCIIFRVDQPERQIEGGHTSKSFILDLPLELLEIVVENLELSDVSSLRGGCRELSIKLFGSFLNRLFAERYFVLSNRASMQMLCDLSYIWASTKSIKCLSLSADILAKANNLPRKPQTTKDGRLWNRIAGRSLRRLRVDEAKFFQDDLANLLETIFENFKRAGASLNILFADAGSRDSGKCRACGLKRICELLQLDRSDSMMTCSVSSGFHYSPSSKLRYHKAVYHALTRTQFAPRGLQLGPSGYDPPRMDPHRQPDSRQLQVVMPGYCPRKMNRLPISWFSSDAAKLSASNLRTLHISLSRRSFHTTTKTSM